MSDNCVKKKCGCQDSFLTTPAPCPEPFGCPEAQPCGEAFDSLCIIYTSTPLLCNGEELVSTGDSVQVAIQSLATYLCQNTVIITDILCDTDVVVPADTTVVAAIQNVVDYFCQLIPNQVIVEAGDNITVTENTVGNVTTYTVDGLEAIVAAGTNVSVVANTVGNTTTYTVSATGGLAPWQLSTINSLTPLSVVPPLNTRTVYNITGAPYVNFATAANPVFGDEVEFIYRGARDFYIQPVGALPTTVEIWQPGGVIIALSTASERLFWDDNVTTTRDVRIKLLCIKNDGVTIEWLVTDQTWNDQAVSVV